MTWSRIRITLLKFIALAIALAGIFPLSLLLRSSARVRRIFWIGFGAAPFFAAVAPVFDIGVITWAGHWIGFVYSLEITVVDIMAVAALLAVRGPGTPLWTKLPLILFVTAAAASMVQAAEPLGAFFGVWQFARMLLVMTAVARAMSVPGVAMDILRGMALGMGAHLIAVLYQRFGLGLTQASGLFIHQNTLGMATHLVLFPALALLFYGFGSTRVLLATVLGTLLVVIFTASRAAVGFAGMGLALAVCLLVLAGLTRRKMMVLMAAALSMAVVAPLAVASLHKRFDADPLREDQYDERAAFNRTALSILADHPAGVGMNHYVYVAKNFGYAERAGVLQNEVNLSNIVHNVYWLTAAETGYLGLIALCLMFAVPAITALAVGWRERASAEGHLLIGCGVALIVVYLHSYYEWIYYAKEVQYPFFTIMGMVYGIAEQLRLRRVAAAGPKRGSAADEGRAGTARWVGRGTRPA